MASSSQVTIRWTAMGVKYSVFRQIVPRSDTRRLSFVGMKQISNFFQQNADEKNWETVSVDCVMGFDDDVCLSNLDRLTFLKDDPHFMTVHYFEGSTRSLVLDYYQSTLEDILNDRELAFFFKYQLGINRFVFTNKFIRLLREVVEGLKILESKGFDYPMLNPSSIVFLPSDVDCCSPKLMDLFAGDNTTTVWESFGLLLSGILQRFQIGSGVSEDISDFVTVLLNMPTDMNRVVDTHPAILFAGDKIDRLLNVHKEGAPGGSGFDRSNMEVNVCNRLPWRDVAAADPYFRLILNYSPYNDSPRSFIVFIRNTITHLNDTIRYSNSPLARLSKFETLRLFEAVFPCLMSTFFRYFYNSYWKIVEES